MSAPEQWMVNAANEMVDDQHVNTTFHQRFKSLVISKAENMETLGEQFATSRQCKEFLVPHLAAIIASHALKQIPDAFSPAEYLQDEIDEYSRKSGSNEFWMLLRKSDLTRETVEAIIAGKQKITEEIADQLSAILGTGANVWLNTQRTYDAHAPKLDVPKLPEGWEGRFKVTLGPGFPNRYHVIGGINNKWAWRGCETEAEATDLATILNYVAAAPKLDDQAKKVGRLNKEIERNADYIVELQGQIGQVKLEYRLFRTMVEAHRSHAPKVDVDTTKRYAAVLGMLAGIRKNYAKTRPILTARIRDIARSALWPEHHYWKGRCDECGLPYYLFPCDMNIQDHLWEKINDKAPGGLLCPTCICKRLMAVYPFTAIKAMIDETEIAHLEGGAG